MLPATHDGFRIDDDAAMAALAAAEDLHFWHRSRNRFIEDRLRGAGVRAPARVLELGCGGGGVSRHLASLGLRVTGVDGHASVVARAAERVPSAEFFVQDLGRRRACDSLPALGFDVVGMFDVIEHLDDPRAALEDAVACAHPGGLVVGTVPALMALWSVVDELAGHRVRYDRASLVALLDGVAGADLVEVTPFNRLLVPLMWLQRRRLQRRRAEHASVENLRVPATPANEVLYFALRAEHRAAPLLDRTPMPGASLWFALRRSIRLSGR